MEERGPDARRPRRRLRWLLGAALAGGLVGGPAGWIVSDRLEQDDAFCVSCHLDATTPLHAEKRRDFGARPPRVLAAAHGVAGNDARADGAFRCIDCHGGVGPLGRARVKLLSARDAFWYAVGHFEEPEGMRWPLWDADCRQCHERFETRSTGGGDRRFHEVAVHHASDFAVACVGCHRSHERGGLPDHDFLLPALVRGQCARCHPEFEEGRG